MANASITRRFADRHPLHRLAQLEGSSEARIPFSTTSLFMYRRPSFAFLSLRRALKSTRSSPHCQSTSQDIRFADYKEETRRETRDEKATICVYESEDWGEGYRKLEEGEDSEARGVQAAVTTARRERGGAKIEAPVYLSIHVYCSSSISATEVWRASRIEDEV